MLPPAGLVKRAVQHALLLLELVDLVLGAFIGYQRCALLDGKLSEAKERYHHDQRAGNDDQLRTICRKS
jgi:hypothetical protein